jgi:aminoglycoside phosphotransferase
LTDRPERNGDTAALDARLADIAARCGLGDPEVIVPGYGGRSHVGVYRDSVVKIYTYSPETKRPREADSLRTVAGTDITPKVLTESDDWIRMTRIAGRPLAEIPVRSRDREMARRTGRYLRLIHEAGYLPPGDFDLDSCRNVLCHGDFSSRNIMVDTSSTGEQYQVTGIIDFEKSEPGCFATDLVRYRLGTLMGSDADWDEFVDGYTSTGPVDTGREHLAYHLRDFVTWAAGWAPRLDPPFAERVRRAASRMISPDR